jgi:hypothetical protein
MKSLHRTMDNVLKVVHMEGLHPVGAVREWLVKSKLDAKGRAVTYTVVLYPVRLTNHEYAWKVTCSCKGAEEGLLCKHVKHSLRQLWSGVSFWRSQADASRQKKRTKGLIVQGANSKRTGIYFVTNPKRASEKCVVCNRLVAIGNHLCNECEIEQMQLRLDLLDEQQQAARPF